MCGSGSWGEWAGDGGGGRMTESLSSWEPVPVRWTPEAGPNITAGMAAEGWMWVWHTSEVEMVELLCYTIKERLRKFQEVWLLEWIHYVSLKNHLSSQATAFTQATKAAVGRGRPNSHKLSDDCLLQAGMAVGNAVMKRGMHGIPEWQRPCIIT